MTDVNMGRGRRNGAGQDMGKPWDLVPREGLEPSHLAAADFESAASTDSAISAQECFPKGRHALKGADYSDVFFARAGLLCGREGRAVLSLNLTPPSVGECRS